jgi:protoheme IX farnesyltransferase
MLPVVAGPDATRLQILLYTVVLVAVAISPWLLGYFGPAYGITSVALGAGMLWFAIDVYRKRTGKPATQAARALFKFSLLYLFLLFAVLPLETAANALIAMVW